jgi:sugar/nucleoside kinase (ribokinase family)
MGYHGLEKYKNLNLLIINEREIRFELRDRSSDLKKIMKILSMQKNVNFLVVTQGNSGAIMYYKKEDKFYECPAFAGKVVDKVGAGDAMLALLSLAIRKKLDLNFSLLLGSLAAAQSVESISNSSPCNKKIITKHLEHILK